MGRPQVPIEVDDDTGVWSVDSIPMILVPRHFFVNNHRAIEEALGRERYAQVRVTHSVFVREHKGAPARVCYMFRGWFCGALEFIGQQQGRALGLRAEETCCEAEGAAQCRFAVTPLP